MMRSITLKGGARRDTIGEIVTETEMTPRARVTGGEQGKEREEGVGTMIPRDLCQILAMKMMRRKFSADLLPLVAKQKTILLEEVDLLRWLTLILWRCCLCR
jgi:hypothetical protein